jgi:O-acetyl-ADP-ribose deacetylase (regulator of RNase III)
MFGKRPSTPFAAKAESAAGCSFWDTRLPVIPLYIEAPMMADLPEPKFRFLLRSNLILHVTEADIVDLEVDGIVSSDDTWLSMGGGVSRRIAEVGGKALMERISRPSGRAFDGQAAIGEIFWSPPGNLHVQYVLQTAIVDWRQDIAATRDTVHSTAAECMRIARGIATDIGRTRGSIAFPLMGTGAGGLSVIDSLVALVWAAQDIAEEPGIPLDVVVCFWPGGPAISAWESVIEGIVAASQRPASRNQMRTESAKPNQ